MYGPMWFRFSPPFFHLTLLIWYKNEINFIMFHIRFFAATLAAHFFSRCSPSLLHTHSLLIFPLRYSFSWRKTNLFFFSKNRKMIHICCVRAYWNVFDRGTFYRQLIQSIESWTVQHVNCPNTRKKMWWMHWWPFARTNKLRNFFRSVFCSK